MLLFIFLQTDILRRVQSFKSKHDFKYRVSTDARSRTIEKIHSALPTSVFIFFSRIQNEIWKIQFVLSTKKCWEMRSETGKDSQDVGSSKSSRFRRCTCRRGRRPCAMLCNERMNDKSLAVSGSSPRENRHVKYHRWATLGSVSGSRLVFVGRCLWLEFVRAPFALQPFYF